MGEAKLLCIKHKTVVNPLQAQCARYSGLLVVKPVDVKLCHVIVSVSPGLSSVDGEWLHLAHA